MPPPGGTRAPLNVTYGWGMPGALSSTQDITQFQDQFQPGIFSPGYPLVPTDPERARVWDYPVGYNYIYTPRSYEPVSFEELRALSNNEVITRLAIETRKDQIEKLDWEIVPRDEDDVAADADDRADKVKEFWEHPDGEQPFGTWLRKSLEDLLVLDAPAFEVLRYRDGTIRGLDIVSGDTIKLLIDITGRRPQSPAPAYLQVIHGRPWRLFTTDELLYAPRNVRPNKIYGYSPVEQILMTINTALRRQLTQLEYFTEGNVPLGILGMPDLNSTQVATAQQYWDDKFAGNTANRRRIEMVPWAAKWQAFKEPPIKDGFDEWLARLVTYAFSLPPNAFIERVNRSTSETLQEASLEEGLGPLMGWVKRFVDYVTQFQLGHQDLEFRWSSDIQLPPETQATMLIGLVKEGIITRNEARDERGMEPEPDADVLMCDTAQGPILLKDVEAISDRTANPPDPPPVPMGGPQKPASDTKGSEVGKAASATFPAQGTPARRARAQRREDAGRRAALAAEATGLLRRAI